ncbi:hypothetical protein B2M27_18235 [Kluyvera intermedia]|uniref:Tyr recombinase domain-containing protein n=1 Tax=Kluyvera intermedia TaxID=61648 RepID=A0ABX3UCP3_KLUIN|nr:tyrosine-type recombinase/integrase [Kluyvera intermedia]ORJ48948.1 hypothetical protein B2M27_18235 [Kluyvera intermedia]
MLIRSRRNKDRIIGQKRPLQISHIWGIRIRLELERSRVGTNRHISTRQYNRIFHGWVEKPGLENSLYSTHSMRRTKPYLIYKKTRNLRVIQLLLGHKKLESTAHYLGIEVDDALEISESIEV